MKKKFLNPIILSIWAIVIVILFYQFIIFTSKKLDNDNINNKTQTWYIETWLYDDEEKKLKITRSDEMYYFELEVNDTINNGNITKENKCETLIKLWENITWSINEIIEYKTNKILESKVLLWC